jgi:hypothetical protein
MQIMATFVAFDTIIGDAAEKHLRETTGPQIAKIMESGKVAASGIYADCRGGFLLLDVDTAAELNDLFGRAFHENFHIETHPVMPMDRLKAYFEDNPV